MEAQQERDNALKQRDECVAKENAAATMQTSKRKQQQFLEIYKEHQELQRLVAESREALMIAEYECKAATCRQSFAENSVFLLAGELHGRIGLAHPEKWEKQGIPAYEQYTTRSRDPQTDAIAWGAVAKKIALRVK